jgi:16S rRNA (guanine1207-N2)-methyltransferase
MHTFYITDLPKSESNIETFLNETVAIVSHSGLHPTERLLIAQLARLPSAPASLLIAGNRTGATALATTVQFPGCAITCHTFDVHHARAILRNLAANHQPAAFLHDPFVAPPSDVRATGGSPLPLATGGSPIVACTAQVPPGAYAAALFMATPGTMTGELILDQLEDIHRNLAPGGTCVIACQAESGPLIKQIKAIFGNLSVCFDKQELLCATAVKKEALKRERDFSSVFPASLSGGETLSLCSLPGVFCHRRPDTGGLALAEIAARELRPGQSVLDMGCGCGLVGILLARAQSDTRVTFIDSHARALAATHRNLETLGLRGHALILSDTGTDQTDFDLFAGNPPYYSDFKIATLFINTAHAALRPGGTCLLVAKSTRQLEESLQARFGNVEVLPRRGYGVVRSLRRE